jgi:hypothetical protein
VIALLRQILNRGVRVSRRGDKFMVQAASGPVPPEILAWLRGIRPEIDTAIHAFVREAAVLKLICVTKGGDEDDLGHLVPAGSPDPLLSTALCGLGVADEEDRWVPVWIADSPRRGLIYLPGTWPPCPECFLVAEALEAATGIPAAYDGLMPPINGTAICAADLL